MADIYKRGFKYSDGVIQMNQGGTILLKFAGMARSADQLLEVSIVSSVPAGAIYRGGMAFSPSGVLYVTTDAVGARTVRKKGLAFTDGMLHVTPNLPSPAIKVGGATVSTDGVLYASGLYLFDAPLQKSLVVNSSVGSGTPTFTRASTAYVQDFEGLYKAVLSGEARFTGARRVANLFTETELINAWGKTNVTTTSGQSDPLGGVTAFRLQGTGVWLLSQSKVIAVGSAIVNSWYVKSNTGASQTFRLCNDGGTQFSSDLTATTSWQRFSLTRSSSTQANDVWGISRDSSANNADLLFWHPLLENATGQSNQNPSEYVSVGVLSAPFHGANVDGVKYFTTLNGNTVASNVVTEATGAAITNANSSWADASGPFGEYEDPAQTDVLGTTVAIRRTMADVGWVSGGGGITVGAATGADGVGSAAASLTAAGANGTILFTTVLGAAVRTYGAMVRRKTGTGTVNITGDNGATWTVITLTTTYQPFYFTTANVANPIVGFRIVTAADAIEVDFNTLYAGSNKFPNFTPVNVNQAATVAQYVATGNVGTNDFTMYGEVCWPQVQPAGSYFLWASYVDANNYTAVLWDGTNLIARRRIGGANNDATKALTPTAGTVYKWAARFSSTTGTDIFYSGAIGTNNATTTACQIGANMQYGADGNGANQSYATSRNERAYPSALSTAQLQAITT